MVNKKKLLKRENNKKDKEWAIAVKSRFNNGCAICNRKDYLNAHHIIPREFKDTKWDVKNGIALCPLHHKLGRYSFHKNGLWAMNFLKTNFPEIHAYLEEKVLTMGVDEEVEGENEVQTD